MTKELATTLMKLKNVYLTSEGKALLEQILITAEKKETSKNV